jgi:hypothetical protein
MLVALILATIVDLALAVLLIAVSGFIFGDGPEGMKGEFWAASSWWLSFAACLAGPVAGFVARRSRRPGLGALITWRVPAVGLCVMAL